MAYILALNCGSSSIKYQIFDEDSKTVKVSGTVEKIAEGDSFVVQKYPDGTKQRKDTDMQNHNDALGIVMAFLREASIDMNDIRAVGHRVVHGGEKFNSSVEITDEVIKTIEELVPLAPLHNPANLMGIVVAKQQLPNARHVAVFDTAFHQTMPDFAYRYAVPGAWYKELGVRRYGFHGTSHLYVSKRAAKMLGKPASDVNLITLHIGSGASATAIKGGKSIDTSMGLTPLAGLVMGTRAGDIDAGIIFYVMEQLGITAKQIETHLNKQSGMLGVTECYIDHRDIWNNIENNDNCRLALDIETNNIKKYIGGFMAELGHVDAIVFTAGIGEKDERIRELAVAGLEEMGVKLDKAANDKALSQHGAEDSVISAADSKIKVFMIPTNEELVIIEDTIAIANGTYNPNHLEMGYSFV